MAPSKETQGDFADGAFLTAEEWVQYWRDYAQHFELIDRIKPGNNVTMVRPIKDNKKWLINGEHPEISGGKQVTKKFSEEYDFVIVGTGYWCKPRIPEISGMKDFKGKIMHAAQYATPDKFDGQNVVLIGASHSGCELPVEIVKKSAAKKIYHCNM